jgi:hypothetical protein
LRRSRLAQWLALVVSVAGLFAPLLYFALGRAAAVHFQDEAEVAGFLGVYRGAVQLATLAAQALLTPALLARAGVAPALLVAPIGAVASALALFLRADLAAAALAQAMARLLDAAAQTPAEKLVQNLMARELRGRVGSFIEGVAKRAGAVLGGVAAALCTGATSALAAVALGAAGLWLGSAILLRRRFSEMAVAELAAGAEFDQGGELAPLDTATGAELRAALRGAPERFATALELVVQLGGEERIDAAFELSSAARVRPDRAAELLAALERVLAAGARSGPAAVTELSGLFAQVARQPTAAATLLRALGVLASSSELEAAQRAEVEQILTGAMADGGNIAASAQLALARARRDDAAVDRLLDERGRWPGMELSLELRRMVRDGVTAERGGDRLARLCRRQLDALRRQPEAAGLRAIAAGFAAADAAGLCAEWSLLRADALDCARPLIDGEAAVPEAEQLAALELCGALGDRAADHLLARALGVRDESVRRAAMAALARRGSACLEVLLVTASFGARRARNAAAELVRDLRLSSALLDDLIAAELAAVHDTALRLGGLARLPGGELLRRRLAERIDEAAHTLFLMLEARLGRPAIGGAARRFLRTQSRSARARALEAVDAVLPRSLALDLLPALEAGSAEERARRVAALRGSEPFAQEDAVRAELSGDDPLARSLVLEALGDRGRASHRADIAAAARHAASKAFDPIRLLARITAGSAGGDQAPQDERQEEEDEMPRSIHTVMMLSQMPLFSSLSTRELSELATLVRWELFDDGEPIYTEGEVAESIYLVESGRVRLEKEQETCELGSGGAFGEAALFEERARTESAVASQRSRLARIDRHQFEELVEEVPGIALGVCRGLSRRIWPIGNAEVVSSPQAGAVAGLRADAPLDQPPPTA